MKIPPNIRSVAATCRDPDRHAFDARKVGDQAEERAHDADHDEDG